LPRERGPENAGDAAALLQGRVARANLGVAAASLARCCSPVDD
jgi:hypothetical protein